MATVAPDLIFPGNLAQVPTIANLKAVDSDFLVGTPLMVVQGYLTAGDGLGGIYVWNGGSLAVDDTYKVVRPDDRTPIQAGRWIKTDAEALDAAIDEIRDGLADGSIPVGFTHALTYPQGTVQNHLKRFITITDAPYNAVGDGVADDSDPIEDAITDANGGTVWIPKGRFKITRKINLAPASVVGEGTFAAVIEPSHAGIGVQIGYTNAEGGINTFGRTYRGFSVKANTGTTWALYVVALIRSTVENYAATVPNGVGTGFKGLWIGGGVYGCTFINPGARSETVQNAWGIHVGNDYNNAGGPFASTNGNTLIGPYTTNLTKGIDLDHCTGIKLDSPVVESGDLLIRGTGCTIENPFMDGGLIRAEYYYPEDGSGGVGPATKPYNNTIEGGSFAYSAVLNQSIATSFVGGAMVNLTIAAGAVSTKMAAMTVSGTVINNGTNGFLQYENGGLHRFIMQSGSNTVLDMVAGANSVNINGPDGRALIFRAGGLDTEMTLNARPLVLSGTQPQLQLPAVGVGSLPAAATYRGLRGTVTDSNVAASGNFGAIVANGGANVVPVYSDGTNWRIG